MFRVACTCSELKFLVVEFEMDYGNYVSIKEENEDKLVFTRSPSSRAWALLIGKTRIFQVLVLQYLITSTYNACRIHLIKL